MAPSFESHQRRARMEAKRGFGASLPEWTRAEDTDHEYDVTIMRKRRLRVRVRRDASKAPSGEANMASSLSPRLVTVEVRSNDDSHSESESEDESDSDKSERGETNDESKLVVPGNDPTLAAPSADGSVPRGDSGMVSGGDGIHSNVHKVLLGVGIVGGFIILLGIGFITWKLYKKRSQQKKEAPVDDMAFEKPSRFENLVSKVPFIGPRFGYQGWYTIDAPSQDNIEKTKTQPSQGNLQQAQLSQENLEKSQLIASPRPSSRRIDSQLLAPKTPLGAYRIGSTRASTVNFDFDAISPTSTMFVESTAVQVQVIARHDPKESITSISGRQHKRVPSTTPYVYDVGRRQTGASSLSSISSGFGDGDIVVTPTHQTVQTFPSQPAAAATPPRLSTWRSTSTLGRRDTETSFGRRDTVSTEVSVDFRPRFHTVTSWVKQQNGHLRRAQRQQESSSEGSTPPVPALAPPPEQDFGLMMPDGERPRPVELV